MIPSLHARRVARRITSIGMYDWAYVLSGGCTKSGNNFTTGRGSWNSGQIRTTEGYSTKVYVSCVPSHNATGNQAMLSLNSDPATDANYPSLDYAWFFNGYGQTAIWESGSQVATPAGGYGSGNVFKIDYDGTNVIYSRDGVAQRTVARSVSGLLYLDSSFNKAFTFTDLRYQQYS
jgi:hypothetical protein